MLVLGAKKAPRFSTLVCLSNQWMEGGEPPHISGRNAAFKQDFDPFKQDFVYFKQEFVYFKQDFDPFKQDFVYFKQEFVYFKQYFDPFDQKRGRNSLFFDPPGVPELVRAMFFVQKWKILKKWPKLMLVLGAIFRLFCDS